ncbi:energy-coupling factor ABC transporter ATP-binding protein [Natronobacterium gregoryi]|uniref:ABC transporter ATP-binding protein n=2 Tax=Natronobacterium gregoryi TaxID=44930 RepID=L0AJD0_NATGS|nr:ABC transporter ATP-binding protein [Natronobacterium gregoryi]AFZ73916.1 ABC-type cobalt transport system, ATPase component [Natronobacterium gregoryi SP2]ELY71562.1 ABC transporter-related protein [Natronobacterium gregoryi SP2]PLK19059.1 ABC transporter ATP-binding protein [Natronobacterium gregoryi SP2]SFJ63145.1 biotin transport system ATP-binding protein [Natronobacterium gregoryi]
MIEFRSVTYAFEDVPVLEELSLSIDDGEFVLFAGANGSGKTTLLRHCNGLLSPDSGTVRVDGTPVEENVVAARASVGMVFQHPRDQFVAATIGADVAFGPENLGLERGEIDRRVENALEGVNLTGREDERIDSLSGGEQARVAIAGALAMEPTHLVLDEPFTGLDEPARESVLERLEALSADGTGILLATHDLRDVFGLADRVIAMADGDVVVDAPPAQAGEQLAGVPVRVPQC